MNENEAPAIQALADALLNNDEIDILDALTVLKPILAPVIYTQLATMCDMCPIHDQDLDSCRDDDVSELGPPADDVPLTACRHLR